MNRLIDLTSEQALRHIQLMYAANRDIPSRHGQEAMAKRRISAVDVRRAVATATSAVYQRDNDSWRLQGGVDTEGEVTEPRVSIKPNCVLLVTVT